MFLKFANEEERCRYGGTAFMELQYCKLDKRSGVRKLFKTETLPIWNYEDALFVYADEIDRFLTNYQVLLGEGMYQNKKSGLCDVYGINYFKPECIEQIMERITEKKPAEYEVILEWLEGAKKYNGFYLLGI